MLKKVEPLPEKKECARFYSLLINSQNKWMARILWDSKATDMKKSLNHE